MNTPTIEQQITFLSTPDLAATAHFYEHILKLELALDQGVCRIYHVSGNAYLGFCQKENVPQPPSGVILTLVSQNVDEWYKYLCEQGISFEKPPTLNETYNIYHCFLRDPTGYLVEIQRFLDPAWPRRS